MKKRSIMSCFQPGRPDPLRPHHPNYLISPTVGCLSVCRRACSVCTDTCVEQLQHMCLLSCWMASVRYITSRCTLLCSLLLFSLSKQSGKSRGVGAEDALFSKISAFCEIVGGPWKYLNLWTQNVSFSQRPFLLLTLYKALYCLLLDFIFPLMGLDQ